MKILLSGATQGSNFGDILFAYLFQENIKKNFPDTEVYFVRSSNYSEEKLNLNKASINEFIKADALVYISGGYFGEGPNESYKKSLSRFINYFLVGIFMLIRKKPISIIGVGAGPLKKKLLKKTAVYLFNKAKVISVRDDKSKQYMIDYGVKNEMTVTSDSAQIVNESFLLDKTIEKIPELRNLKYERLVLVHIPIEKVNKYRGIVIEALKESLFDNEDISFVLTYDGAIDSHVINDIKNEFPNNRTIVYNYQDPLDFIKLISLSDTIITTKLHTGILGACFNKSVISFPMHYKTTRYYKQIGHSENSIPFNRVNKYMAKNMIDNLYDKKVHLSEDIRINANKNFELLNKFIDELKD